MSSGNGQARGIDHVLHAAGDFEAATAFYETLGFTLTPEARHPFGTGNRLAQLQGDFVEVLSVINPDDVPEAAPGAISFGAEVRDFLGHGDGLPMLALTSSDWQADRAAFEGQGLDIFEPFGFERRARQPDGSEVTIGFRLTFVAAPDLPGLLFFTCHHQHAPDYFYKPKYQDHANGAVGVSEVMMTAADPGPARAFITALGIGDCVSVATPKAFEARFEGLTIAPGEARLAGYRLAVADLAQVRWLTQATDIACNDTGDVLWIGPDDAFGAVIAFVEEDIGGGP